MTFLTHALKTFFKLNPFWVFFVIFSVACVNFGRQRTTQVSDDTKFKNVNLSQNMCEL